MTAPCSCTDATRLVVRHVSELLIGRSLRWKARVGQDPFAGLVFETVLGGSIAHRPFFDPATRRWVMVDDAPAFGRPVTANAIAQSMLLPATTTRRRAGELVAAGQLIRAKTGFLANPDFIAGATFTGLIRESALHLARLTDVLAAAGYAPAMRAKAAGTPGLPSGLIERPMIVFELRISETMTQLHGSAMDTHLFSAIVASNVRHITANPELARQYADEDSIPPDRERRPVTIRALARAIDMPFETVRRRIVGLVAQGKVEHRPTGVVVPTAVLAHSRHAENNRRISGFFAQMLDSLSAVAAKHLPR